MATLADLILRARQHADMVNSTFVEDPEWTVYVNGSYGELYDLLVSRFEDYYSEEVSFTLSGTNSFPLPTNFYKVRGVDMSISGSRYVNLDKFNFDDRNDYQYTDPSSISGSFILWQIPRFTPLVSSGDVCGDVLDFEEYIVVDAAIKALNKEESDVSVLMAIKSALTQRIRAMASNRDTRPDRITDVTSRRNVGPNYKYRVMGGKIIIIRSGDSSGSGGYYVW